MMALMKQLKLKTVMICIFIKLHAFIELHNCLQISLQGANGNNNNNNNDFISIALFHVKHAQLR